MTLVATVILGLAVVVCGVTILTTLRAALAEAPASLARIAEIRRLRQEGLAASPRA
ncbi:MAG: hypothetical protein KatS3mg131_2190 [Candidatus Tectimicrobiota bacterium]|nr:MAG: hypothetical protein KatS3mg131_2190 [Candidatus Tectomicrobia bacterium]